MSRLKGKSVLVTGGGSGIGLASARMLLAECANVAIAGRDEKKLQAAVKELNAGERLFIHRTDVTDKAQVTSLIDAVTKHFGQINILINNAGANIKGRAIRELTPEIWDRQIATNLNSAYYCVHAVLPQMREHRDGIIINVSSTAGKRAYPLAGASYAAAKFAMAALGTCLGVEEKDNGIRVTNLYPGEVDSPILDHRPEPVTAEHRSRILQPEDVAAAVVFVCTLPPRAHVPELVIKPTWQVFV